ncbi:hypothetical protein PoMZ_10616 [Pyricularia oryzae]|uniref:Uncharacterized protein n=1 Tax=Pyricularia oryzae TaxID=318829 RepID=A0A4P7N4M6_PYROR|nr:hypothetical protein PoMZ_10616 [Pyricularia oryzae]
MLRRRQVPGYRLNSILPRILRRAPRVANQRTWAPRFTPTPYYHIIISEPPLWTPRKVGASSSTAPPRMNHFNIRYPRGTSRTGIVLASACY